MKVSSEYNESVFLNCPFDQDYDSLLKAIVFTVYDCGFQVRCALQEEDASQIRIDKICSMIADCRYGIHDLSRTELDPSTGLPRFNMPFELGIFLGVKRFASTPQSNKRCLIMDREQYRYHSFISDISGQDIKAHGNESDIVITIVRNWLRNSSRRTTIPGGQAIISDYNAFNTDLPEMCVLVRQDPDDLIFNDYALHVTEWLKATIEQ